MTSKKIPWEEYRRQNGIPSPPVTLAGDFIPRNLSEDEIIARAKRRKELEDLLASAKCGNSTMGNENASTSGSQTAENNSSTSKTDQSTPDQKLHNEDKPQSQKPEVTCSKKKKSWVFQWGKKPSLVEKPVDVENNENITNAAEMPTVTNLTNYVAAAASSKVPKHENKEEPHATPYASTKVTIMKNPPNDNNGAPPLNHAQYRAAHYTRVLETFCSKEPESSNTTLDNPYPWTTPVNKFYNMIPVATGYFSLCEEDVTLNLVEFVRTPIAIGSTFQFRVLRERKTMGTKKRPIYFMHLENGKNKNVPTTISTTPLMKAQSKKKNGKGSYEILLDPMEDLVPRDKQPSAHAIVAGKLSRNFFSNRFTLSCQSGDHQNGDGKYPGDFGIIIYYRPNRYGVTPMAVSIPPMISESKQADPPHLNSNRSGRFSIFRSRRAELDQNAWMTKLRTKAPRFSPERNSYELNFLGRVTRESVKNFQLIHPQMETYTILQFGKVSDDVFTVDVTYPLCPLQAFGIILTRFLTRL